VEPFQGKVAEKKAAPVPAASASTPRSAVAFGFGGKLGPKDPGFVPGFESYKLRFGPGDWAGTRIIITSAWGDKNPETDLWNWPNGRDARATDALSDKDGYYFIYSLATANAANWVVANFRYTLRDGRHGVANALIPYQGDPKIDKGTVAVLGFVRKVGPKDEGYVPDYESYQFRFGPGDWAGTKFTSTSNWGEGTNAADLWGWNAGAEAKSTEVRRDAQGYYFVHSLKSAGHSRWVASLFRFTKKDGKNGVAQALYPYSGAPNPPKPVGQPDDYPIAPAIAVKKAAKPTARMLAAARPTAADLNYLRSLTDALKETELDGLAELTTLDLTGKGIDDAGTVHLRGLKRLEKLVLRGTQVGDAGLENVVGLGALKKLNLIGTPTTDAGLEVVGRLTGLTELFIDQTQVTVTGLRSLRNLKRLESLSMTSIDVGDAGLLALRPFSELRYLNFGNDPGLDYEKFTPAGLDVLKAFPKLEKLGVAEFDFGDGGFAKLRAVPNLEWLNLLRSKFRDEDLAHLQGLPKLKEIHLDQTPVTDAGLAHLKSVPSLRFVLIGFSDVGEAGCAHLAENKGLLVLSITKGNVTDAGVARLKGMTTLNRLFLPDNKVTGAGLASLRGLTGLNGLNLYYNQLDDASLATLRSMPELRALYISGEKITDAGLVHIKELKKLEYLSISWTKATQAGIDDLKKSLPGLRVDYGDN
jgi:Leucine-rich repeat (LRR) protein